MSNLHDFPFPCLSIPFLPSFQQLAIEDIHETGLLFGIHEGKILTDKEGRLPSAALLSSLSVTGPVLCIGQFKSGLHAYAATIPATVSLPWVFNAPRNICATLNLDAAMAFMRAMQLLQFQSEYRFCSKCGGPCKATMEIPAVSCQSCGQQIFPPISPAVLVLVEKEGQLLLAHNARFPENLYSLIAGFCEAGEPAENTVVREVYEEVGIAVHDVKFMASQSWPYPHSLMLGFSCQWHSGEIHCDDNEITDAHWYDPCDLPLLPNKDSLARKMIEHWLEIQHIDLRLQTYPGSDLI